VCAHPRRIACIVLAELGVHQLADRPVVVIAVDRDPVERKLEREAPVTGRAGDVGEDVVLDCDRADLRRDSGDGRLLGASL
jgi:hypothetical protein